jgi:hypothetical protein
MKESLLSVHLNAEQVDELIENCQTVWSHQANNQAASFSGKLIPT